MSLIKTTAELANYVEVTAGTDFSVFQPSIRTAERRFIVPVLGDDQYTALLTAYNASTLTSDQQSLLDLTQEALANIALSVSIARLSVQISDAGVRRSESDSLKTAYQYQERSARDNFAQSGFDALEDVLAYLDKNQQKFATWTASDAYKQYKTYFIQSGSDFSNYYAIKQSRLVYLTIAPMMRNVENFYLKPLIGKPLFDALKAGQLANNLSDDYQTLMTDYICPGIALHTIARGMMQRSLEITENGVSISLIGRTLNIETREQGVIEKFQAIVKELTSEGDIIFANLVEELAANPLLYPDYVAPAAQGSLMNIVNTQASSLYGA